MKKPPGCSQQPPTAAPPPPNGATTAALPRSHEDCKLVPSIFQDATPSATQRRRTVVVPALILALCGLAFLAGFAASSGNRGIEAAQLSPLPDNDGKKYLRRTFGANSRLLDEASVDGIDNSNESEDTSLTASSTHFLSELEDDDDGCSAECCAARGFHDPDLYLSDSLLLDMNHRRLAECEEESSWVTNIPFAVQLLIIIILVCLSGLFSGLTLGLMGLDKTGLEIVMEGDDEKAARAARRIYPVRSNGNLLLCTLLLGNVAVNALLSIVMADITSGLVGFIMSTVVIVIFGEILPQAACSRYALQVGYRTVPIVKVIMVLLYPAAGPLAFMLDKLLGHEIGTTYSKAEMRKLLEIHVNQGRFNKETGTAMKGALNYQDMTVNEVMTPLENVFMLNVDEKLSFETIATIFKTGYSRLPVYEVSKNNIIGLLFVKDLIFIDPEDETPVRNFVQIFGRGAHVVWPDDKLGDVLRELKTGRSHMAIVRDVNNEDNEQDPFYEIRGIITLEDIIEVILGDDIVDETDAFVDATHSSRVERDDAFEWARLRLLDAKIVDESLSEQEVKAVTAHLRTNYSDAVELLSDRMLQHLVAGTSVTEVPEAEQVMGEDFPSDLMYKKGTPCDTCTLILGGKVTVLVGSDNFRSDVSSWSVLAPNALTDPSYVPDFTAFVAGGPCRCLRFTRERFLAAVDASAIERRGDGAMVTPVQPGVTISTIPANKPVGVPSPPVSAGKPVVMTATVPATASETSIAQIPVSATSLPTDSDQDLVVDITTNIAIRNAGSTSDTPDPAIPKIDTAPTLKQNPTANALAHAKDEARAKQREDVREQRSKLFYAFRKKKSKKVKLELIEDKTEAGFVDEFGNDEGPNTTSINMQEFKQMLTEEGKYIPAPRQTSGDSPPDSPNPTQRDRSSSFQYIESSSGAFIEDDKAA